MPIQFFTCAPTNHQPSTVYLVRPIVVSKHNEGWIVVSKHNEGWIPLAVRMKKVNKQCLLDTPPHSKSQ